MIKTKALIIGSGPAGYTAGIYLGRAGFTPLLITGNVEGGQLTQTPEIENFPGFPTAMNGFELMMKMQEQATTYGTEIKRDFITDVNFSSRPFKVKSEAEEYEADVVIIATGATPRKLGIESEKTYTNKGISYCATCDGFFFKKKKVAVIGGGNTAVEEALYLSNFCEKVTLIHRRDELRAEKVAQDKLFANEKIEVIWDSTVEEFVGDENSLTGIKLKNKKTEEFQEVEVAGAFIAIGHIPNSKLFKDFVETDDEGYIKVKPSSTATNVEGVFACGDVADPFYKQAVIAAGTGAIASIEAEKMLD